jgi:hypothetical protein
MFGMHFFFLTFVQPGELMVQVLSGEQVMSVYPPYVRFKCGRAGSECSDAELTATVLSNLVALHVHNPTRLQAHARLHADIPRHTQRAVQKKIDRWITAAVVAGSCLQEPL